MKKTILFISALALVACQPKWQPTGDHIRTAYADQVSPDNVLPEYPRPQLQRETWVNLNGFWQYAITDTSLATAPNRFDKHILVPFALESALSGTGEQLMPNQFLWYHRTFSIPGNWRGQRILLHFGAIDWKSDIYVNGQLLATHTGGFTPFTVDVTDALTKGKKQDLTIRVYDPTDAMEQPIGKQRFEPYEIWYTPVSGIWQTVWMEPVAMANHIEDINTDYKMEGSQLTIMPTCAESDGLIKVQLKDADGQLIAEQSQPANQPIVLTIANPQLWTPNTPYLYAIEMSLEKNGEVIDQVSSYTTLREIGKIMVDGYLRFAINGKAQYLFGPLDQGWWPDGLYTAPTDEALKSDIILTKELGFNLIRKHIKVEPARWYYYCDQLGVVVWQDMPSADHHGMDRDCWNIGGGHDQPRSEWAKQNYYKEWGEIIDALRNFHCIITWVPFNEAWAQFDTEKVVEWTEAFDPTRLVNAASGGNLRLCGDIIDFHNYPGPAMPYTVPDYINVLGEYGGLGYSVPEHLWWNQRNWGYAEFQNSEELTNRYVEYATELLDFVKKGMAATIYTQTTDVEIEVNGFVTYDRKVSKFQTERVREINQTVVNSLEK